VDKFKSEIRISNVSKSNSNSNFKILSLKIRTSFDIPNLDLLLMHCSSHIFSRHLILFFFNSLGKNFTTCPMQTLVIIPFLSPIHHLELLSAGHSVISLLIGVLPTSKNFPLKEMFQYDSSVLFCLFTISNIPSTRGYTANIGESPCHLDICRFFFSQPVIERLNGLPQSVVNSTSISSFKKGLDTKRKVSMSYLRTNWCALPSLHDRSVDSSPEQVRMRSCFSMDQPRDRNAETPNFADGANHITFLFYSLLST